jgi:hypothetical protein
MLKTHPYRDSGEISSIDSTSVERLRKWPSASCRPLAGVVVEVLGEGVEASNALLLVTETRTNRLGNVQHVGDVVPAVWVVNCRQVVINHARSVLFEKANE